MTTIAANRETIAADSLCSVEYMKGFLTPKLFRVGNSIYGTAGDNFSNVFIDWAQTGFNEKKKPILEGDKWFEADFEILELAPTGLFLWDKYLSRIALKDQDFAIGSGGKYAIVFMRKMGMSPEEAVKMCCELDDYTREPVDVMRLKVEVVKVDNDKVAKESKGK